MYKRLHGELVRMVSENWAKIEPLAGGYRCAKVAEGASQDAIEVRRRRGARPGLLTAEAAEPKKQGGAPWASLRPHFVTLIEVLEAAGCFVLRRGTIEGCY